MQRDKKIADMSKTIGELSNEIDRLSDKIADIPEIIEKEKANWDLKQQYALELQEDKISNLKNEMKFLKKEYDTAVNELKKSEEKAENQNILLQKTQEKLAFVKQIEIIKELYLRDQTEKIKYLNLSKGEQEELKTLCISQKEEISRLEKMNVQLRKLVIQKDQLVVKKASASRERQDQAYVQKDNTKKGNSAHENSWTDSNMKLFESLLIRDQLILQTRSDCKKSEENYKNQIELLKNEICSRDEMIRDMQLIISQKNEKISELERNDIK